MPTIKVCKAEEVTENSVKVVPTRYGRVALVRLDGVVCAFEDVCTHDDGPLGEGEIEGEEIICPRHGARFNMRTGKAVKLPATADIETFPARVNGGQVEVDID